MSNPYVLTLHTALGARELTRTLADYAPWSHRIDFDNGVSTKDFERRTPFAENTLQKIMTAAQRIPFGALAGGRLLDVGCNAGYNAIFAASEYGLRPVGIDVVPRHVEMARFLAGIAGVDGTFLLESGETFSRPAAFDVVLHFGTLYHLRNPLLSLEHAFANLRAGGYLALETQVYEHPADGNLCYFMHLQNDDPTNFWALSPAVLLRCLELTGFVDAEVLLRAKPAMLEEHMARLLLVARKPPAPA
ncbi:MAG: methyltransferase domain-containing protein [Rhodothermales bacterium]|nr:methyltransferase domain-containing protein [Rhodothermales bacterium]